MNEEILFIITTILSLVGLFGSWIFNYTCSSPQSLNRKKGIFLSITVIFMIIVSFVFTMQSHRENKIRLQIDRDEMSRRMLFIQTSSNETNMSLKKALSALDAFSRNSNITKTLAANPISMEQFKEVIQDQHISSLASKDKSIADTLTRMRSKVTEGEVFSETPPLVRSSINTTRAFSETPPVVRSPTKTNNHEFFTESPPVILTPRGSAQ